MAQISHVLLDADGVLQHLPGGWFAAMEPYVGDRAREFLLEAWAEERPFLSSAGDYRPLLEAQLARYGVTAPVAEVREAVWHRIEPLAETLGLVASLRRAGYGVHLGTNQDRGRGEHMRTVLRYDEVFDTSCYSWELGVAKPAPAFFREAARRIDAEPARVLFVDDGEANVLGAREAGMLAERWSHEQGHAALLALLAAHGVVPST